MVVRPKPKEATMPNTTVRHNEKLNVDIKYVQTRISEVGSTQNMTVQLTPLSIQVYEGGTTVGSFVWTGKTFKVFYKDKRVGGAFRSIDSAIVRFKTEVKNQKYCNDMRHFIG